jgi:hypothetical protein
MKIMNPFDHHGKDLFSMVHLSRARCPEMTADREFRQTTRALLTVL